MSLLKRLDPTPDFAPREDVPSPERLIEGSPSFRTWAMDEALVEAAPPRAATSSASPPETAS